MAHRMASDSYALVVDGTIIAKGNKKAMHKLRKLTPGSTVYFTMSPVGASV